MKLFKINLPSSLFLLTLEICIVMSILIWNQ